MKFALNMDSNGAHALVTHVLQPRGGTGSMNGKYEVSVIHSSHPRKVLSCELHRMERQLIF